MSDCEALVAAVEEAQRILGVYDCASPRRNQDELLAMLQFILCDPSVAVAVRRLKNQSPLESGKVMQLAPKKLGKQPLARPEGREEYETHCRGLIAPAVLKP